MGKRMAQHPYDRVQLLNAGVKVSGDSHEYLIPFNQLLSIHCKRGLVWGELEFILPGEKVVRLHGTEWTETQRFYHYLNALWQQWSAEMSEISADLLRQQLADVARSSAEGKWLTRQQVSDIQQKIRHALSGLPVPTSRLEGFENCRELWRQCQSWLGDTEKARLEHNQKFTESMLEQYRGFFAAVESSPLNPAQARAVVNGERSLLVLAGAGSGKTSVLVARAGWLLTRGEAAAEQILLLAFGRQAAQEMDERIRERLGTDEISARTFHALALHIIQQGSKKAPMISKLENDSAARQKLLLESWQQQCQEKKAQAKGWRLWLEEEMGWPIPEGDFWQDKKLQRRIASRLDRWVSLMRMHGGSQAEMIAGAPEEVRDLFSKRVKLMALY
ncbi:DNA helicase IV [Klebsiella oxytoca]|nr:DNA helicase IV [Klebsiella oxytoca]